MNFAPSSPTMSGIKGWEERKVSTQADSTTTKTTSFYQMKYRVFIYYESLIHEPAPPMSGTYDWRRWKRIPLVAEGDCSFGEYRDRTRAPPPGLHADHAPQATHLEMRLDGRASCPQYCHLVPSTWSGQTGDWKGYRSRYECGNGADMLMLSVLELRNWVSLRARRRRWNHWPSAKARVSRAGYAT